MWRGRHTPEPWRLHPFHDNIVIADNPELWANPELNLKEVFVARNANRLPDYDQALDTHNMKRIVTCVNFCKDYSTDELYEYKPLRIMNNEPEKDCVYFHSTTPWEVDAITDSEVLSITRYKGLFRNAEIVVKGEWQYLYDRFINSANCHRIVACVNFCEGYSNKELDSMNLFEILQNQDTEIY
jgi:hypothetical protein